MADWGSKVSQLGYDVNTAADNQLLYSSSWPLLMIHTVVKINVIPGWDTLCCDANNFYVIDYTGAYQIVYNHGLGYPPIYWTTSPSPDISAVDSYVAVNTRAPMSPSGSYLLYIFRRPIDVSYTAPTLNLVSSTSVPLEHNYGIKVSKPGKDISSTDLRDFAIHSSSISPMIHAIYTGPLSGAVATSGVFTGENMLKYTHGLGYTPQTLFYAQINADYAVYPPNAWTLVNGNNNGGGSFDIEYNSTYCAEYMNTILYAPFTPSTSWGSMVVLKDPFNKPVTNITF